MTGRTPESSQFFNILTPPTFQSKHLAISNAKIADKRRNISIGFISFIIIGVYVLVTTRLNHINLSLSSAKANNQQQTLDDARNRYPTETNMNEDINFDAAEYTHTMALQGVDEIPSQQTDTMAPDDHVAENGNIDEYSTQQKDVMVPYELYETPSQNENSMVPGGDVDYSSTTETNMDEYIDAYSTQQADQTVPDVEVSYSSKAETIFNGSEGVSPTQQKDSMVPGASSVSYVPLLLDASLADVTEPYQKGKDTALFWHVPKSGGTTVKDYIGTCFDMVMATTSRVGITQELMNADELEVVRMPSGRSYVNVDMTSTTGITRAKELGLASSGLTDIIVAPLLYDGSNLFDPEHRGRMFALFRHPVVRAASMFNYLQQSTWEPTYKPHFKDMTLEQYARGKLVENNFITRRLVNKRRGPLTQNDVVIAKDIMRRKCLIGITTKMDESLDRFTRYFGWEGNNLAECKRKIIPNRNSQMHLAVREGTTAWALLEEVNYFDIQLYAHAITLFEEQESIVEK